MLKGLAIVLLLTSVLQCQSVVNIGTNVQIPLPASAQWSQYVNVRPGSNETVTINPPLFSWFAGATVPVTYLHIKSF